MFQAKQFKVSSKKGLITIKVKLSKNEELNEREIQIFQRRILRGMIRPEVLNRRKLQYAVTKSTPLKKYLKNGISKQQFFQIFVQLLEITVLAESSGLNRNNLVLNLDYVYINEDANAVQMIYLPIFTQDVSSNIFSFLYDMIHTSVFLLNDDMHVVNDLMEFMHKMQHFSAEEIEDYIEKVYPEVFKTVVRYKPEENQKQQFVEKKQEVTREQAMQPDGVKPKADAIKQEMKTEQPKGAEENNFYDTEIALRMARKKREQQRMQRNAMQQKEGAYLELVRKNRKEHITISKPEFWIGTDPGKVDYCVEGNPAVSRQHAVIRKREEQYFIQDNHSTNKTYVNNRELGKGQEFFLSDGDGIIIANEKFEFHIHNSGGKAQWN